MTKIKQNLRDLLEFLTYFGDDFNDWHVQIISHQDYSEFKASTSENRVTFTIDKKWLMGQLGSKFIEIDLTNMDERIKLVGEIKKYLRKS